MFDSDRYGNGGQISLMWYHARCIFNTFLRARKTTRTIESEIDIEGLDALTHDDQEMLRKIIDNNDSIRNVRFRSFEDNANRTPQKRGIAEPVMTDAKKRRIDKERRILKKGDRVWTHFRCLPRDTPSSAALPPGAGGAAMKSAKPELAMVFADPEDASIIVQFESTEHEKDRIELYKSKKGGRIRGWLRYPRIFEGRKQRVDLNWIQWKRHPPALCGCVKQEWKHACDCGISCGKSSVVKVWGVGSCGGF